MNKNKLFKSAILLVVLNSFAFSSFAQSNVDASIDAQAFKAAVVNNGVGGQWGGTFNAKYFASVLEDSKQVFRFDENGGVDGGVEDAMDIKFSLNPKNGLLNYVYTVTHPSPSGTDQEICVRANPANPDSSFKDVREDGTALPRVIVFKSDAIAGGLLKAKAQIVAGIEKNAGHLSDAQKQALIKAELEKVKPTVVAAVEAKFSRENVSKGLYEGPDAEVEIPGAQVGNDIIAIIQGKKCLDGDSKKSWNELQDLNVPVIRAEIVDGALKMRAVVKPINYGGENYQGFSIYEQIPGSIIPK